MKHPKIYTDSIQRHHGVLIIAILALVNFAGAASANGPPPSSPPPKTIQAKGTIEVAFSPRGGAQDAVVRFINESKTSIRVAAYGLTANQIGQALIQAHKRGVDVKVVVDRDHNGRREGSNSVVSYLVANGIPVRIDKNVKIQHSKNIVSDTTAVLTGSMNFTMAGELSNRESTIILRGNPELAKIYTDNWLLLWNESEPVISPY